MKLFYNLHGSARTSESCATSLKIHYFLRFCSRAVPWMDSEDSCARYNLGHADVHNHWVCAFLCQYNKLVAAALKGSMQQVRPPL